jgi:hypothetical protein
VQISISITTVSRTDGFAARIANGPASFNTTPIVLIFVPIQWLILPAVGRERLLFTAMA